ncbi:MAG: archaetidylserine decarboxylase [Burkholderiales bacterium]|nr:archaetidylserine decarboxylase [Burkholderiales bacterium]
MTPKRSLRERLLLQEDLNFLLTNRIPRLAATRFMGWFSRIESPLLTRMSIAIWRIFAPLDLGEAQPRAYRSLRECFIRELRPGLRPVHPDPAIITSPCDGIVGACGSVQGTEVFQAKGFPYSLEDLFGDSPVGRERVARFRDGVFVTLRLTSTMYHRFHAPADGTLTHLTYISGDTWNVNPIALKRVEKLFCKNERAVLDLRLDDGAILALVPVAAVLVASMRFHCADVQLNADYAGPNEIDVNANIRKGKELGWFEHGSTIIVFAPRGFVLAPGIATGANIRMGQPLLGRMPSERQGFA